MLKIFYSNTTLSAGKRVIAELGRNDKEKGEEVKHVVIVPDRYSLSVEQDVYEYLEKSGSFNIDVVTFTRLAIKGLRGNTKKCLSKEGTVFLLKKVIDENRDYLEYYKNSAKGIDFAREMFAVLASFRNSGIKSEDLAEKAKKAEGSFALKIKDIALLYGRYNEALSVNYIDTTTRIEGYIGTLNDNKEIRNTHFYVIGFNFYSQIQLRVISALARKAGSVNIACAYSNGGINAALYPVSQLEKLKDELGAERVDDSKSMEKLAYPFDKINSELFGYGKPFGKSSENVVLYVENSPYTEIKAVGREIKYLVREGGLRYRDIAIVCCNDSYKRIYEEIFCRFEIPFFLDRTYAASTSIAVRYVLFALEVVLTGYKTDKVMNLIKHPYFGIKREEVEAFDNYVLQYNIKYSLFQKEFTYGDYEKCEAVRQILTEKTKKFESGISSVSEFCQMTREFCLSEELEAKLEEEDKSNLHAEAALSLYQSFLSVLDELVEILGEETIDFPEFYSLLASALARLETALLPQTLDSVFIGSSTESRFSKVKALFVTGANGGYFPLESGEPLLINEMDTELLKKQGLTVYPTPIDSNRQEKFVTIDLLTKGDRLYVGCAEYGISGAPLQRGEGIKELSFLLKQEPKALASYHNFSESDSLVYQLVNSKSAYYDYLAGDGLAEKYSSEILRYLKKNDDGEERSEENKDNLLDYFFVKEEGGSYLTSVSQLEKYFSCPYAHYLRYGLSLTRRKTGELMVMDVGIVIHRILEIFFKSTLDVIRTADESEILKKAQYAIRVALDEAKASQPSDVFSENILSEVSTEMLRVLPALVANVQSSSFTPKLVEYRFGKTAYHKGSENFSVDNDEKKDDKRLILKTQNGNFIFTGKIDRVDCFEKDDERLVTVIDYKTGSSSNLGKLDEVYCGIKIQLYIYIMGLKKLGYKPAGVFYLPVESGYKSEGKSRFLLKGQYIGTEEILESLDPTFAAEYSKKEDEFLSSTILDIALKKGKLTGGAEGLEQITFDEICEYVTNLVTLAITQIGEGNISKSPITTCDYCDYSSICDKNEIVKRKKKKVDGFSFYRTAESALQGDKAEGDE